MHRALAVAAVATLAFAALLITGIVQEMYILLYFGMAGMPTDISAEKFQQAMDAWSRSDFNSLGAIGGGLLRAALLLYFLRSLVYLAAVVLTIFWLVPYLKRALDFLRQLEGNLDPSTGAATSEERKRGMVNVLRTRAARKRVESYASFAAALISLALGIGFVTRDYGIERPDALDYSVTSPDDAMNKAETLVQETQSAIADKLRDVQAHEQDLLAMVRDELGKDARKRPPATIKSNEAILSALLSRQASGSQLQTPASPEVARDYVAFAQAQLDVVNHQAELEVLKRTVLVIAAKLAAVVLIFALAQVLVRLYQRGLELSLQYDAMADALQLSNQEITADLGELRRTLTPQGAPEKSVKLPISVLHALQKLVPRKRQGP